MNREFIPTMAKNFVHLRTLLDIDEPVGQGQGQQAKAAARDDERARADALDDRRHGSQSESRGDAGQPRRKARTADLLCSAGDTRS